MAANDSGKTIAVLALVGILGAGAFMGNSWLNAQHADHNIVLNDFGAFRSALSGDAEAQYTVGKFYADAGEWQNAIFWLDKSADQGNGKALSETAMAYLDGRDGVPKDVNHACRNLEKVYDLHKDATPPTRASATMKICRPLPKPCRITKSPPKRATTPCATNSAACMI